MLLTKPLEEVTEADLLELIADREDERQIIDYKKGISLDNDPARNEFRADVTSFANTSGGHIILGMDEVHGCPTALCGMDVPNPESFRQRLEELLQTKIAPRLYGVQIRTLAVAGNRTAAIVRIPQSFSKPHQVHVNKDDFQFWARNSNSKYRLNVEQLRSVILQSEAMSDRIQNFRRDRLGKIISGENKVRMQAGARTVLHMLPLSGFDGRQQIDLGRLVAASILLAAPLLQPPAVAISEKRFNLHGYITMLNHGPDNLCSSYLQVFRNGSLEAVEAESINHDMPRLGASWSEQDEHLLMRGVTAGFELLQHLNVSPPVLVAVSLLGVANHRIYREGARFNDHHATFEDDPILLPDVLVEDMALPAGQILRPAFDAIWNAGGFARCLHYDENGARREVQL